ncbi:hypothetical protein [Roseomonas genomospecies 6]|uniref:hypothetical protein n=1 Tax=Roseomonas genomospecies 6 TaxID=214106 RepID=UPI0011F0E179|nr:hypothetical protein [Roseomonas genomospecies 6]
MRFIIANTFQNSLAKQPQPQRRLAKEAEFNLKLSPATPGFRLHRIERSRDPGFWSARVNDDLRIAVHRAGAIPRTGWWGLVSIAVP